MGLHWRLDIERLCATIGELSLGEIRQHVLVDAANQLLPHGQAATKNSHVIAPAAAILHYAAENELCPHIKVRRLKEKKSTRRPVRKDDAVKLLDAATGDLRLLLIFLFHQGWRISDTLRLTWRDIDLDAGIVTYRISKTDDCLDVPLADVVLEALRARPDRVGRVFPWRDLQSVYRALQPVCEAAGVAFTPHRARALLRDMASGRRGFSEGDHGGGRVARLPLGSPLRAGRYPSRAGDHESHKSVQTPCRRLVTRHEIKKWLCLARTICRARS